jgi:hypothetical protein
MDTHWIKSCMNPKYVHYPAKNRTPASGLIAEFLSEWVLGNSPAVKGEALSNGELNVRETCLVLFQLQQGFGARRQTQSKAQTSVHSRICPYKNRL